MVIKLLSSLANKWASAFILILARGFSYEDNLCVGGAFAGDDRPSSRTLGAALETADIIVHTAVPGYQTLCKY